MKQIKISTLILVGILAFSLGTTSCKKEKGCMNKIATNYNADAEEDDGSCIIESDTATSDTAVTDSSEITDNTEDPITRVVWKATTAYDFFCNNDTSKHTFSYLYLTLNPDFTGTFENKIVGTDYGCPGDSFPIIWSKEGSLYFWAFPDDLTTKYQLIYSGTSIIGDDYTYEPE